jgi:hypothetical protein
MLLVSNSNNAKLINRTNHQLATIIFDHTDIILTAEYFHPYIITAGKDKSIKL